MNDDIKDTRFDFPITELQLRIMSWIPVYFLSIFFIVSLLSDVHGCQMDELPSAYVLCFLLGCDVVFVLDMITKNLNLRPFHKRIPSFLLSTQYENSPFICVPQ